MAGGVFVGGPQVNEFERNVEAAFGVKHCVALNSGTDALICALYALGVSRGDEVITTPNSFIASTAAIVHLGAVPIFVDVLSDQNIDDSRIEAAITTKTKVIMPVHLTGRMANMYAIDKIAKKYNLYIVEDAAQSIGSTCIYNEKKNMFFSPLIDGPIQFTDSVSDTMRVNSITRHGRTFSIVRVPYAFKLLQQELQSMMIEVKLQ